MPASIRLSILGFVLALLAGAGEASALSWREIGLPPTAHIVSDPIRNRLLLFNQQYDRIVIHGLSLTDSTWSEIVPDGQAPPLGPGYVRWAAFDSLSDRAFLVTSNARLVEISFSGRPRWGRSVRLPLGGLPALAFDSKRRRIVGFGGPFGCSACESPYGNELVVTPIDSLDQTRVIAVSEPRPSGRSGATMVYDSALDRVVLYGGRGSENLQRGVWACTLSDPPAWQLLADAVARENHQAVYDPIGQRMWVLGDSAATRGLWGLSLKSPAESPATLTVPGPTSRQDPRLSYDGIGGRLLYHAGSLKGADGSRYASNEIWGFPLRGPSSWIEIAPAARAPAWVSPSDGGYAAHDPQRDLTWVVSWPRTGECALGWLRPDGRWTRGTAVGTTWRREATLTLDKRRGRMLLFGGQSESGYSADLYELRTETNPARWVQLQTSGLAPEPRIRHSAVYDSTGDRLIVVGGITSSSRELQSVWELRLGENPPRWVQLPPIPSRFTSFAAYDEVRGRLMVPAPGELWWLEPGGSWQRERLGGSSGLTALDYDAGRGEWVGLYVYNLRVAPASGVAAWIDTPITGEPYEQAARVFDRRRSRWIHLGRRTYELPLPCPSSATARLVLPDATFNQPYRHRIEVASAGPRARLSVASEDLPLYLNLDPLTRELFGNVRETGRHRFAVTATDDLGCAKQCEVSLYVRPCLTARASSACTRDSVARVTYTLSRGEAEMSEITRWTAWIRLPPGVVLAEPCVGDRCPSVEPGGFFAGCTDSSAIRVREFSMGLLKLEGSTPDSACGSTERTVTLFSLVLGASAVQGSGLVEVVEMEIETLADARPGPVAVCGATPRVAVGRTSPPPVSDLAARTAAGGSDGTLPVRLVFTTPAGAKQVKVYRADGSVADPAAPIYPPGPPWALTSATLAAPIDRAPVRGFYSYVMFSLDSCGNASPASNLVLGVSNYRLGDFWSGAGTCTGDNAVDDLDYTLLREHYGSRLADPGPDPFACLDIGPTTTGGLDGFPLADQVIDFEDLAIFAMSYGAGTPRVPGAASGPHRARLAVPARIPSDGSFVVPIELDAAGDLLAVRFRLQYDESMLALEEVAGGTLLGPLAGRPFVEAVSPQDVDLAMCGGELVGRGEAVRLTFRVIGAGTAGLGLAEVEGRSVANRPVAVEIASDEIIPRAAVTFLSPASPNPATGAVAFRVGLAEAGPARLAVFDLQGRRVRELLGGAQGAGERVVSWDGRSDAGEIQPAGLYVALLETGGTRITRRWVFVP